MRKTITLKKTTILLFALFFLTNTNMFSQAVRIANGAGSPDASAILDIVSTNKGLLVPRVDLDDVSTEAPISSPATGLLIYNQGGDEPDGFYYWNGSNWTILVAEGSQEVSHFQDTDQEPTGLIECQNYSGYFITPNTTIPDNGILNSTMTGIVIGGKICDIIIQIDGITHSYDDDLDITIESPSGTIVELTTDNGGTGDDYTNTFFSDDEANSITSGSAPFTGWYRPEGSLSDFDGEDPDGDWTLHVEDDSGGDEGTLVQWTVWISTAKESAWEFVGEASITYKKGTTPVISSYYSANPTNDTGNKIRISRSTISGDGDVGTSLAYSAASPYSGSSSAVQGVTQDYFVSLNAFYHDDENLIDGTTYYYKLWKAGKVDGGENYAIIPILINE